MDNAIDANAALALDIHKHFEATALQDGSFMDYKSHGDKRQSITSQDFLNVTTTMRHIYRDWSREGDMERRACYFPVLHRLTMHRRREANVRDLKVLVPGSGLGRLAFEIAVEGYQVEANELSFHQVLASDFFFNFPSPYVKDLPSQYKLFPFATSFSNQVSVEQQLQYVTVPDGHAGSYFRKRSLDPQTHGHQTHSDPDIRLILGNFNVVYREAERKAAFDVIVTVFFIDTATNFLEYIKTILHCLKDDGLWINQGPLYWRSGYEAQQHDQNGTVLDGATLRQESGSVELTEEEVFTLVKLAGFDMEYHHVRDDAIGYAQNRCSMFQSLYRVSLWVARRNGISDLVWD